MTLKGGSSQACAACKYQRRKCSAECPLAPYFPPDKPKLFQNVHKLFGVRNILRILSQLDRDQKPEAMSSIIFQSNMRDMFPVSGCWEAICFLRWRLQAVEEEYNLVLSKLELCRQQQIQDVASQLGFGRAKPVWCEPHVGENDRVYVDKMEPCFDTMEDKNSYNNDRNDACESSSEECLKDPTLFIQHLGEK